MTLLPRQVLQRPSRALKFRDAGSNDHWWLNLTDALLILGYWRIRSRVSPKMLGWELLSRAVESVNLRSDFQLSTSWVASTSRSSWRDPWSRAKCFLNQPVNFSLGVSNVLNSASTLFRYFLGDGVCGSFPIDKACPAIVGAVHAG